MTNKEAKSIIVECYQRNLKMLEGNNIRSDDLYSGDAVNSYLAGDIRRIDLKRILSRRKKEMMKSVSGIDRLLNILSGCPNKVEFSG